MKRITIIMVLLLAVVAALTGCTNKLDESDVSYAGEMVDNMLAGIEDRDYDAFSRDFSDTMKSAMTEDSFIAMADLLDEKIGTYESKSFSQAVETEEDGAAMTVVVYKAQYSDETDDVLITVTFSGSDGDYVIEGLYFNSPNLRES